MTGLFARLRGRRRKPPPRVASDWSSFGDHGELSRAAGEADWLSPEQFLAGPFRRFLELASADDGDPRHRARIMEFARHSFLGFCDRQVACGADGAELEARARGMAAAWFARPDVADGDYMLEVFDGISTHNYRGTREG